MNLWSISYLVLANILASGHRELSPIDISIQSHTLERTHTITRVNKPSIHNQAVSVSQVCYCYLRSVGTGQAQLNDEDRLRGDYSVRGGVGRRSDRRVCAALSCQHTEQSWG